MDKSLIQKHYDLVLSHYPNINLEQLGLVMIMLCSLRVSMGHELIKGTLENYIHKEYLSEDIKECINFLECEILGIRKSRIDIDYWKKGNQGCFRNE